MVGEKQIFLFPSVSGCGLFSTGSSVWMPSSLGLLLLFKVIWSLTPTGVIMVQILVGEVRVVGFWGLLTTQGRGLLSFNAPVGGDRKLLTLLP